MRLESRVSSRVLGPEEVNRLGGVFDQAWKNVVDSDLARGRRNVDTLRDLVGQIVWVLHDGGTPYEDIPSSVVEILRDAARGSVH